jgi:C1A family cysteine protease
VFRGALLSGGRRTAYPSSFDLRTLGRVSPVKDQRPLGTCWAFAAYGSMESCLLPGELRDFSEDNVSLNSGFDAGGDPYSHGGNFGMVAAYLLRWAGPVEESADPYGDGSSPAGLAAAKHVQEVLYIPGGTTGKDTANIKYALTSYGAVSTLFYWDEERYKDGTGGYFYNGRGDANHAVTIVGWDDAFPGAGFVSPAPGDGAWLVKNSWGDGWGQGGYFWVSYYDRYCGSAISVNAVFNGTEPASNYGDVYSYDPLGQTDVYGFTSTTVWGANVFTARRNDAIVAVGFYTHAAGTAYTIRAGPSLYSLQDAGSGSVAIPGFHTVKLSSPLSVAGGRDFVVAVGLTSPDDTYPLSVEKAEDGYSSAATASPGQSFASYDGVDWTDLSEWDRTANVCLKAYTAGSPPSSTPTPSPSTTPAPPADSVGPVCAAKNVTVKRYGTCSISFMVHDVTSARVTRRVVVTTKSGVVKMRRSWDYGVNRDSWWSFRYRCPLPTGSYRIVVSGEDLAGNSASVVGRATLTVK